MAILLWPLYSMMWTFALSGEPFPTGAPSKRKMHPNAPYSTPPCTKCVGVRVPRYTDFLRGLSGYRTHASPLFYVHICGRQRAHNGSLCENLALHGGKFWGVPPVRKMLPTEDLGAYSRCKFRDNVPKDYVNMAVMAPWFFAEKRKWNQLWDFPKSINVQCGAGITPIAYKDFRPVC